MRSDHQQLSGGLTGGCLTDRLRRLRGGHRLQKCFSCRRISCARRSLRLCALRKQKKRSAPVTRWLRRALFLNWKLLGFLFKENQMSELKMEGIIFGYANDEVWTERCMKMTLQLVHDLNAKHAEKRRAGEFIWALLTLRLKHSASLLEKFRHSIFPTIFYSFRQRLTVRKRAACVFLSECTQWLFPRKRLVCHSAADTQRPQNTTSRSDPVQSARRHDNLPPEPQRYSYWFWLWIGRRRTYLP